ncbi:unnamed protein product [Closterium sp. NIES-64]|nr:unnamed protein product [Closterium sp. NIES-64]
MRRHLPTTERAHHSQYKSAQTLYDAVVARYSSPATAALSRLMLPYLFPDLATFPAVADLITHLRTSDTRYRAALPAEFCAKNPPPMYITLYYIVTRLPDSLRVVRDHFLPVCPTTLTVDLLEKALLAIENNIVAVGASRGDPRTTVFEGRSLRLPRAGDAAPARARGARALEEVEKAVEVVVEAVEGVGVVVGVVLGVAAAAAGVEAAEAVEVAEGAEAAEVVEEAEVEEAAAAEAAVVEQVCDSASRSGAVVGQRQQQQRSGVTLSPQQLREWYTARQRSGGFGPCSYVLRTGDPTDLGIEACCARCCEAAALGASASAAPGASASAAPGAGESALSAPSGTLSSLYLPSFSTNLVSGADLQDRGVDEFTPGSQRVIHYKCARTGRHLATFTRRPGSSLYTLTAESPPTAASSQVFGAASRGDSPPPLTPSEFPPTEAPVQTLHMDVWGPARVSGQRRERYFLLVVDDYSRYTIVFPLRSKGEVTEVLVVWIRAARKVGDVSAFRVWGSRAFVCDFFADKLSPRAVPCVFLSFHPDVPGWQFYHPTTRRVLSSQDVTFDESVPYYRLFPYRTAPLPPPPLFLAPGATQVDPLPPQGPAPSCVSQVDAVEPVEVAVDSGAARGAEPAGAGSAGAGSGGGESGGAETGGAEPGGAESGGAELGGAGSARVAAGGTSSKREPLSPHELRVLLELVLLEVELLGVLALVFLHVLVRLGVLLRQLVLTVLLELVLLELELLGVLALVFLLVLTVLPELELLELELLGVLALAVLLTLVLLRVLELTLLELEVLLALVLPLGLLVLLVLEALRGRDRSPTGGLPERREPASCPASPVRAARTSGRTPRPRPAVPGTHQMALRPSTAPLRVPLPSPPESSLPSLADPESDSLRAASPSFTRLLATVVTDPSFESAAASALVGEPVDFAARCRLDYATSLVAESESVCPHSVGGECALSTDVFEDRQEEFQCFAACFAPSRVKRPPGSTHVFKARYVARGFSQRQGVDYFQTFSSTPKMTTLWVLLHLAAQRDYELHSLDFSTAFLQGSLHEEIWLRRPPGFTGSFPPGTQWSLRRPVYGLRQAPREWHDTLRTTLAALGFAPSTADPSLFLRTDTSLPPFYIVVYIDDLVFVTAYTAGLAHAKAQRTITLTQSHMVEQVLQRFGFTYSSPQATPLSTRHSLSALPSDESVESSGPYPELVGCLMYLMTCTRPDLAYPLSILARFVAPGRHRPEHMAAAKRVLRYVCSTSGMGLVLGGRRRVVLTDHADASWADDQATQRSSQGYTFSLGSGSVSWRFTRSSSVLGLSCEAEIYVGAMAVQELCWLTYLLTDLGEPPRSPLVLYVDNKAMLALCREHRLEHRMKHIALRYVLSRELQQRGQLHLTYVASEANTADIFIKTLPPCDHQRFCTMLGLVSTWPHLLTS